MCACVCASSQQVFLSSPHYQIKTPGRSSCANIRLFPSPSRLATQKKLGSFLIQIGTTLQQGLTRARGEGARRGGRVTRYVGKKGDGEEKIKGCWETENGDEGKKWVNRRGALVCV